MGDIIDKNLCELAIKKAKRQYKFSAEGAAELVSFHKRICESLRVEQPAATARPRPTSLLNRTKVPTPTRFTTG
jgi:Na+/phosphate symporter